VTCFVGVVAAAMGFLPARRDLFPVGAAAFLPAGRDLLTVGAVVDVIVFLPICHDLLAAGVGVGAVPVQPCAPIGRTSSTQAPLRRSNPP